MGTGEALSTSVEFQQFTHAASDNSARRYRLQVKPRTARATVFLPNIVERHVAAFPVVARRPRTLVLLLFAQRRRVRRLSNTLLFDLVWTLPPR